MKSSFSYSVLESELLCVCVKFMPIAAMMKKFYNV